MIVAAQRGLDLYLHIDPGTGHIITVGTATELQEKKHPIDGHLLTLATLDGASDLLEQYGWRATNVPICDVLLPRTQLVALARAVNNGDTHRRADILRHATPRTAA